MRGVAVWPTVFPGAVRLLVSDEVVGDSAGPITIRLVPRHLIKQRRSPARFADLGDFELSLGRVHRLVHVRSGKLEMLYVSVRLEKPHEERSRDAAAREALSRLLGLDDVVK